MPTDNPKVMLDDFRISYVFDVEEPVSEERLVRALEEHHFQVVKQRYIVAPPIRAVLLNLATRKNTSVMYQKDNVPSFIGVSGKDKSMVLDTFSVLQSILVEVDSSAPKRSSSIEMVSTVKVFGEKRPEVAIPSLSGGKSPSFDRVFGTKMTMYTVSYKSADQPDSGEWAIRIEPLIRSPRYYFIQLVYRDRKLANVLDASQRSEEVIREVVSNLEG